MWLRELTRRGDIAARVLCLPPAGAGAASFRSWAAELPDWLGAIALELPGHGVRAREQPLTEAADVLDDALLAELADFGDRPLVLFGFSMGGLLGLALGRALSRAGRPPALLVAAACEGPANVAVPAAGGPSDEEIVAMLREHSSTPAEMLENPDYLRYLIPVLRADVTLSASLAGPGEPLSCPILSYLGQHDASVPAAAAESWAECTTGGFGTRRFPGGHFFVLERAGEVVRQLVADIDTVLAGAARAGQR